MARSDRQKASDVFREAEVVFARKATFAEAFPEIESADVRVSVSDFGESRSMRWGGGEYVDCPNPLCYNGGVSVGSMLRQMVSSKEEERTFEEFCQGYEGSPKGRRKYGECMRDFKIVIHIKYKPDSKS